MDQEFKSKNNAQKIVTISLLVCLSAIFLLLVTGIFPALSNFLYGVFGLAVFGLLIAGILSCVFSLLGRRITIKYRYVANFIVMYVLIVLLVHAFTSMVFINDSTDFSAYVSSCYNYLQNDYSSATFGGLLSAVVVYPIYKTLTAWGLYIILILGLLLTVFVATNFFMKYYSNSRSSVFFEPVNSENKVKQAKIKTSMPILKTKAESEVSGLNSTSFNQNNFSTEPERSVEDVRFQGNIFNTQNEPKQEVKEPPKTSAYDKLYGDITSGSIEAQNDNSQQTVKPVFDVSPTVNFAAPNPKTPVSSNDTEENVEKTKDDMPLTYSQSSPKVVRANPVVGQYNTSPIINAEYLAMKKQLEEEKKNNPVKSVETVNIPSFTPVATSSSVKETVVEENDKNDIFMEVDASEFNDISINSIKPQTIVSPKNDFPTQYNEIKTPIITDNVSVEKSVIVDTPNDIDSVDDFAFVPKTTPISNVSIPTSSSKINEFNVEVEKRYEVEDEISQDDTLENSDYRSEQKPSAVLPKNDAQVVSDDSKKQDEEDEFVVYQPYNAPDLSLLDASPMVISVSQEECLHNKEKIEATLEDFKIPAKVVGIVMGPTVTRYELSIGAGVSVNRLPNLANDMAVRLAAKEVRWEIPIPGKELVGLEVPNKSASKVPIREILASDEFQNSKGDLSFAIGIDISGKRIVSNIAEMPHMLVAGGSGSGKSVSLNSLIISLLYKYSPEQLRLVLIDPKLVEFTAYEELPHLMVNEIISDTDKIVSTFKWLITEMERRYKLLRSAGVLDIANYNKAIDSRKVQRLPRIVVIVDELADIMTSSAKTDVDTCIMRLAQKARAAGIHLILATQRPSVQVVNGNIKNNFSYRMALKVASNIDSRTILDTAGAEKLLGRGDMLFKMDTSPEPIRLQGAFISKEEVDAVVAYVKANNEVHFSKAAEKRILKGAEANSVGGLDVEAMENDPEFIAALRVCLDKNKASTSSLQSILRIGWNKALRIMEAFEALGYVSPAEGSKPRQLFITREQFEEKYGNR